MVEAQNRAGFKPMAGLSVTVETSVVGIMSRLSRSYDGESVPGVWCSGQEASQGAGHIFVLEEGDLPVQHGPKEAIAHAVDAEQDKHSPCSRV